MSTTLPITPDALLGERDRLEGLLQASEDWRALGQLRARHGDDLTAVSAARLEALLLDALAANPFYQRYTSVAAALERCGNGIAQYGSSHANGGLNGAGPALDDLKKIRGIDSGLERRLHALDIRSFEQIADWGAADVRHISDTLGLGRQISAQNWIEQAAMLARAGLATPAPVKKVDAASPPKVVLPPIDEAPLPQTTGPVAVAAAKPSPVALVAPVAPTPTATATDEIVARGPPPKPLLPVAYKTARPDLAPSKTPDAIANEAHDAEPNQDTEDAEQAIDDEAEYLAALAALEQELLAIENEPLSQPAETEPQQPSPAAQSIEPLAPELQREPATAAFNERQPPRATPPPPPAPALTPGPTPAPLSYVHSNPLGAPEVVDAAASRKALAGLFANDDPATFRSLVSYVSFAEEASVEIVSPTNGNASQPVPPPLPMQTAAKVAAAAAAAAATAQHPSNRFTSVPPPVPRYPEPQDDQPEDPRTLGRFFKALTGS